MRLSRTVVAVATLSVLVAGAYAVGCGESFENLDTDTCDVSQCSRKLTGVDNTYCVRGHDEGGACRADSDCYINLACEDISPLNFTGTCRKTSGSKVAWKGYIAAGVAVLAFGSNFIPARRVDPGNGLYFQFFMSTAILCAGFGVQMYRGNAFFYPYAMLGGMLWCIGNTLAVPALKLVSMGLAVALWGGSNMLLGWASGHFGFWGITTETVKVNWIGYVGVAFSFLGVVVLAFVKKSSESARRHAGLMDDLGGYGTSVTSSVADAPPTNPFERVELGEKEDINDYLSKSQQRILGTILAITAGCFFGINFDPPTLLMDEFAERSRSGMTKYSPNGLDYVFSHFFGIFVTALVELVIFSGVDSLVYLPTIFTAAPYHELIVPGFICGCGWAVGQISWFVANDNLGLVVSFPVVALGPSIVASAWSVFLFREIRGMRNYILLGVSFLFLAIAATCTVFARNGFD